MVTDFTAADAILAIKEQARARGITPCHTVRCGNVAEWRVVWCGDRVNYCDMCAQWAARVANTLGMGLPMDALPKPRALAPLNRFRMIGMDLADDA